MSSMKNKLIRILTILITIVIFICVFVYYGNYTIDDDDNNNNNNDHRFFQNSRQISQPLRNFNNNFGSNITERPLTQEETCPVFRQATTQIDTSKILPTFSFEPPWIRKREYWDEAFEEWYQRKQNVSLNTPFLKVVVVPHSHNDPGWLKTFEQYYEDQTSVILDNMVKQLTAYTNMTFIWSEIAFLSKWWESADTFKKQQVHSLIREGKLEIVTGGWVMTDEATTNIYGMLDQLIEGHQWIKKNLKIDVKSGWSVDPFGHGASLPYLLKNSGIYGTVIQRIHYAWKEWFARHECGDFLWRQNWDQIGYTDLLTHNLPFDIYSIKGSCGPHANICLQFDFRKISGEFSESNLHTVLIDDRNVKPKAELLLESYRRTGSLFPHNVALIPLGDDFRYNYDIEWQQQYKNYQKLFDYINSRKSIYKTHITFGTPGDYFKEIIKRSSTFPTLQGDFFVYSDIFSEGRPAYWSGYYTTRPFWKILSRNLESNLRSAEILYTFALNKMTSSTYNNLLLQNDYDKLVKARQNLALFQHHDAITGTSKAHVMHDYALKLTQSIQDSLFIQNYATSQILINSKIINKNFNYPTVISNLEYDIYKEKKLTINLDKNRNIIIFNSLAQERYEEIKIRVSNPFVKILNSNGWVVNHQVNPIWTSSNNENLDSKFEIIHGEYEIVFIAHLEALSLNIYKIEMSEVYDNSKFAIVYCNDCLKNTTTEFQIKSIPQGDVQLENGKNKIIFDGKTGFLKTIFRKKIEKLEKINCEMNFGLYQTSLYHNGPYLFMTDNDDADHNIIGHVLPPSIIITSGIITSEIKTTFKSFLTHTARIYHDDDSPLPEGIYIENDVNYNNPPIYRDSDFYMRIRSNIDNGNPTTFYTDSNGFQIQKRTKIERINIFGNYYPITNSIFIQDNEKRLTLLTNHAQGATSWKRGNLEIMLDRKMNYDDGRGVGEGIYDNKQTLSKYWLLLEDINLHKNNENNLETHSLLSNYLSNGLNYPSNIMIIQNPSIIDNQIIKLISKPFPCDVHLLNFRTLTDTSLIYKEIPSKSSLMILHRQGFSCSSQNMKIKNCNLELKNNFKTKAFQTNMQIDLNIKSIQISSLTGMKIKSEVNSFNHVTLAPMDLLSVNITTY